MDEIGIVNGLAWTSVGGEILPIEVAVMEGTGKIELTGSLGDVMQESAKTAITCIRSHAAVLELIPIFTKQGYSYSCSRGCCSKGRTVCRYYNGNRNLLSTDFKARKTRYSHDR